MTAMIRQIIHIDEEKCDGCGLCVSACAEGAIRIVDGKARLVSDNYCDGLGACIGECPQDAITIVEREAEAFDEEAVKRYLACGGAAGEAGGRGAQVGEPARACPGSMLREPGVEAQAEPDPGGPSPSQLRNWPVQMHLIPPTAPFLRGASLLLAADCVGFSHPDFHRGLLRGRKLIVGCPKLDDAARYREKLAAILRANDVRDITVAFMEVPCCLGMVRLAREAVADSGRDIPVFTVKVGITGEVLEDESPHPAAV